MGKGSMQVVLELVNRFRELFGANIRAEIMRSKNDIIRAFSAAQGDDGPKKAVLDATYKKINSFYADRINSGEHGEHHNHEASRLVNAALIDLLISVWNHQNDNPHEPVLDNIINFNFIIPFREEASWDFYFGSLRGILYTGLYGYHPEGEFGYDLERKPELRERIMESFHRELPLPLVAKLREIEWWAPFSELEKKEKERERENAQGRDALVMRQEGRGPDARGEFPDHP